MSTWGQAQDALHNLLWGYESDSMGTFAPGLLHDLEWERVHGLTEPILRAIAPLFEDLGRRVERERTARLEEVLRGFRHVMTLEGVLNLEEWVAALDQQDAIARAALESETPHGEGE